MSDAVFDVVAGAIVVRVRVQPSARRSAVGGRHGDSLRVKVTEPPVDDRANAAVCALLASFFAVPQARVEVIGGRTSRQARAHRGSGRDKR